MRWVVEGCKHVYILALFSFSFFPFDLINLFDVFFTSIRLMKIHKTIYSSVTQLSIFLHNEWCFHNSNMLNILTTQVPPAEREIFGYDYHHFNVEQYFK